MELSERLGHAPGTRVLIVSCDDLGFCQATNAATYAALREGPARSAAIMMPGPWARPAAAAYRGEDVGVQLTLNAEHDLYRWGPLTHAPSLLDGEGAFPRTVEDVWEHADLDEVRREWRAQIERAVLWGFNVSHLTTHLAGVELKPEFFDVLLDLAEEFRLPVRLPGAELERRAGFPLRALAEQRHILAPERVLGLPALVADGGPLREAVLGLPPGLSEVHTGLGLDTAELREADPDWRARVENGALLGALGAMAAKGEIALASYRELCALMR